ncbi:enoyl-CoA hydratase [bacterium]|nr:enoyl-CoA hydratase [bacterium]
MATSNNTAANDTVLLSRPAPGVALLTLNRPDRLNAWNGELSERYFTLMDECVANDEVRVLVVTGAGKGFCAGADMNRLKAMSDAPGSSTTKAEAVSPSRLPSYTTTIPKPVIAAINGACAGVGLVHALTCDIRFAAAGAKFTTAFARRGLIAEYGISWLLPRLVGTANALDVLLSGRVFLAEEAHQMGMVNGVVPGDQLLAHAVAYASDLAANVSPASMKVMKEQVYADATQPLSSSEQRSLVLMEESKLRPDFKEGVASFMEKRPPQFAPVTR